MGRTTRDAAMSRSGPTDDERRDHVGGVPVQVVPGSVVPRRRPRVGVTGGYLHIAQGNPSIKRSRNEAVPEAVWGDALRDPSLFAEALHDARRGAAGHGHARLRQQQRTLRALPDAGVDGPEDTGRHGDSGPLMALPEDAYRAVAAFIPEVLDVD